MLGGFRLLLSVDGGHVRHMDGHEVCATSLVAQLGQSLDEGHALDITDSASKLDDADIRLLGGAVDRDYSDALDPVLDGICDVGYAVWMSAGKRTGYDTGTTRQGRARAWWCQITGPGARGVELSAHLDGLSKVVAAALLLDDLGLVRD